MRYSKKKNSNNIINRNRKKSVKKLRRKRKYRISKRSMNKSNTKLSLNNSKKANKRIVRRTKRVRKRKTNNKYKLNNQTGGSAMGSIMSMMPFGGSKLDVGSGVEFDLEEQEHDQNQKVMVNALCNQFMKNNIRGKSNSEYDPLLDNLCNDTTITMTPRRSTRQSQPRRTRSNVANNNNNNNMVQTSTDEPQSGGMKMPSFLDGVKGLAKIYSMPMRAGYNAINGGVNFIKSKTSSSSSSTNTNSNATSNNQKEETKS